MDKQKIIAEIMNGETSVYVRCAAELGYDRGYARAIEDARKEIETSTGPTGGWLDSPKAVAAAIRALAPEGQKPNADR